MQWIDIEETEEYPKHREIVLVADKYNDFVTLGRFIEIGENNFEFQLMFIDEVEVDSQITHWMKCPQPPLI